MLFIKLKLNYFGRFHDREIELKPGINLIYGDNEAGKSTIHAFIKGMLFGIEKMRGRASLSRTDTYSRYLPWDYPGAYSGSMDIRIAGKDYRLQRSFHANDKSFNIIELSTGRLVKLKDGVISELIPGLTESTYQNTISIEQLKARTDAELAAELRNYITNLSVAGTNEIDVKKALGILNEKRKALEATDYKSELMSLHQKIEAGLANEERMDKLSLSLKELLWREHQLKERIEAVSSSVNNEEAKLMEQLPAILEKYKSYQEMSRQLKQLKQKQVLLREQIASKEAIQLAEAGLDEDMKAAEQLKAKEQELLMRRQECTKQNNGYVRLMVKGIFFTLLPFLAAAAAVMLKADSIPKGKIIYCLLFAAGMLSYALLALYYIKKQQKNKKTLDKIDSQLNKIQSELAAILMKYRLPSAEAFVRKQKEAIKSLYELENLKEQLDGLYRRENELEGNMDILYDAIMKYMQYFIREDELTQASVDRLKELIRQKRQKGLDTLAELTAQYNDCKLQIEKLKWEMSKLENNEKELLQNQERYKKLSHRQQEAAVELEAVKLAIDTINELSTNIHDSFGTQLNNTVSEIVSGLTAGRYNQLKINENLEVKVGIKDDFKPLDKLSAGTIDQIYFCLRLAVADLLLGEEELPLLLDDSFALYDDSRVKAAIAKISERNQVILFSCHRREERIIKELGLPCNFIDLSPD